MLKNTDRLNITRAGNPFLLGLLVQVLLQDTEVESPRTIAEVYRRVVGWMREQCEVSAEADALLTVEHTESLGRLWSVS